MRLILHFIDSCFFYCRLKSFYGKKEKLVEEVMISSLSILL